MKRARPMLPNSCANQMDWRLNRLAQVIGEAPYKLGHKRRPLLQAGMIRCLQTTCPACRRSTALAEGKRWLKLEIHKTQTSPQCLSDPHSRWTTPWQIPSLMRSLADPRIMRGSADATTFHWPVFLAELTNLVLSDIRGLPSIDADHLLKGQSSLGHLPRSLISP